MIPDTLSWSWSDVGLFRVGNGSSSWGSAVLLGLFTIYATSKVVKFLHDLKQVNYRPGPRPLFHPWMLPGAALPPTWWNPGMRILWNRKFSLYQHYQSEVVSLVATLVGRPTLITSNLDVMRQVSGGTHKTSFIKHENASAALLVWGMNLVAADGEIWRKHRRIMGPAFNNKLYEYVWDESIRTFEDMISAEGWANQKTAEIPKVQRLTFKFALFIISKCAFGLPLKWSEPPTGPDGAMPIQVALRTVADDSTLLISLPEWAFKLPIPKLRKVGIARTTLMSFIRERVEERKNDVSNGISVERENDAFTKLVQANEDESGKYKLDDEELIGNVFIMLFAGHETTAHTLAATLGFLAYYQDIQEDVYEHILSVVGKTRKPVLDDYNKLDKVIMVLFESLRMFPSGHILIRQATEDTVLTIPEGLGQEGTKTIPVAEGTQIIVDMVGLHYNPRYFDEPEKFKPSRWNGVQADSELFTAFSTGPRACIGRKFAMTEAVAFLTMLLRDWKVEPLLGAGETREQWKERTLNAGTIIITLGVADTPIKLVRRD